MLKTILRTFILSLVGLSLLSPSYALEDHYLCARYNKLKVKNEEKVLAVGIRKVYTDRVEVYVLGFGSPIKATLNGERVGMDLVSKRRTLRCGEETIGQMRIYDLNSFNVNTGLFEIESGGKVASTYVEIN